MQKLCVSQHVPVHGGILKEEASTHLINLRKHKGLTMEQFGPVRDLVMQSIWQGGSRFLPVCKIYDHTIKTSVNS